MTFEQVISAIVIPMPGDLEVKGMYQTSPFKTAWSNWPRGKESSSPSIDSMNPKANYRFVA
jgi:hypothetical protein